MERTTAQTQQISTRAIAQSDYGISDWGKHQEPLAEIVKDLQNELKEHDHIAAALRNEVDDLKADFETLTQQLDTARDLIGFED